MADTKQDSATEALKKVYVNLAQAKLAPDAHGPAGQFIDALMNAIQKFIQMQATSTIGSPGMGAAGMGGGPGGPPGGPGAGGPQMGPPPGPNQIAPGGGAGMAGLAPTPGNMDEMRRMLTAGGVNP